MEKADNPSQKYLFIDHTGMKILAAFFMTIDHIGLFFINSISYPDVYYVFRLLGRLAFPLFAFLAVEGLFKSHDALKYSLRLLFIGLAFDLVIYLFGLIVGKQYYNADYAGNTLTELGLGILALYLLQRKDPWSLLSVFPMAYMVLSDFPSFFPLRSEYGTLGLMMILAFYLGTKASFMYEKNYALRTGMDYESVLQANGRLMRNLFNGLGLLIVYLIMLFFQFTNPSSFLFANIDLGPALESFGALAIPFICLYSGRKGFSNKASKVISYLYYPLHFLIMFVIWSFLA